MNLVTTFLCIHFLMQIFQVNWVQVHEAQSISISISNAYLRLPAHAERFEFKRVVVVEKRA